MHDMMYQERILQDACLSEKYLRRIINSDAHKSINSSFLTISLLCQGPFKKKKNRIGKFHLYIPVIRALTRQNPLNSVLLNNSDIKNKLVFFPGLILSGAPNGSAKTTICSAGTFFIMNKLGYILRVTFIVPTHA